MARSSNGEFVELAEIAEPRAYLPAKGKKTPRVLRSLRLIGIFAVVVSGFPRTLVAQTPPKQALIETSAGTVIVDLAQDIAPNQVAYFIQTAQKGEYDGTVFHRAIKYGMVQGGDPLSKDPSKRS